jgi:hypothetical protein
MLALEFNLGLVGFLWLVFICVALFVYLHDKKNNVRDTYDICWPVGDPGWPLNADHDMAGPSVSDGETEETLRNL